MATTYTIEAGRHWRHVILVRLHELELRFTEIPNGRKSTFVVHLRNERDEEAADVLQQQITDTLAERHLASARRKAKQQAAEEAQKLATKNFFRKLTFRKPLTALPAH
jgi:hypothetical protein